MVFLTTTAAVAGVLQDNYDGESDLTPFIETADSLVQNVCSKEADPTNNPYSASQLEMIERWLAAHFYIVMSPMAAVTRHGPFSDDFKFDIGRGFKSTVYGQQAMRLDYLGGLSAIDRRVEIGVTTVGVFWAGTPFNRSLRNRPLDSEVDDA